MTLYEQLQQLDAALGALIPPANAQALEAAVQEVAAVRPAHFPPDADLRGILAGKLLEVEESCKAVRGMLGVEFTVATKITMNLQATLGPAPGQQANTSSATPTDDSPPK